MRDRRGMLAVSAAGILWGTLGLAVRVLQDGGLSTVVIAFWRLVLATAALALVVGLPGLRDLREDSRRPWRLLAVGGFFTVFQLTFFVAVQEAGVAVATLVTLGIAPVAATAADAVRERRPPSVRTVVIVALAVAGLALVSSASGADATTAPRPALGVAASLVSGLSYAASAVVSGPLSRRLGPSVITAATSAVALVLVTPLALAAGPALPLTATNLVGIGWLGLVTTALAYGLFYAGLRTTPGSIATVLTLLEPATAVVLAVLVLGEPVTVAGVAGTLLLVGAVAALYVTPRAPRRPVPPPA